MACFVVPVAEAIVTSVATRILESKENKSEKITPDNVFLGVSAVALGLVAWIAKLLITDPKHIFKRSTNHE